MKFISLILLTLIQEGLFRELNCPTILEKNIDFFGNDIILGRL